jgi:hypothetical protein
VGIYFTHSRVLLEVHVGETSTILETNTFESVGCILSELLMRLLLSTCNLRSGRRPLAHRQQTVHVGGYCYVAHIEQELGLLVASFQVVMHI